VHAAPAGARCRREGHAWQQTEVGDSSASLPQHPSRTVRGVCPVQREALPYGASRKGPEGPQPCFPARIGQSAGQGVLTRACPIRSSTESARAQKRSPPPAEPSTQRASRNLSYCQTDECIKKIVVSIMRHYYYILVILTHNDERLALIDNPVKIRRQVLAQQRSVSSNHSALPRSANARTLRTNIMRMSRDQCAKRSARQLGPKQVVAPLPSWKPHLFIHLFTHLFN
jgi:hypothetical protein